MFMFSLSSLVSDLNNPDAKNKMRQEMDRITEKQKEIFKETFPVIYKDFKRNGLALFAKYFSEYPHYKNIWPQFRTLQDSALLASNELANHCSVYMSGLKASELLSLDSNFRFTVRKSDESVEIFTGNRGSNGRRGKTNVLHGENCS